MQAAWILSQRGLAVFHILLDCNLYIFRQRKGRVEMTSHKIRFKQISHSKCSINSLLILRLGPSQRIQKSIFAKNKNLKMFTGSWYLGLWVVSLGCVNVEKGRWFGITNASA
jgi:hypothetical protein